ncbi:hypothetical protein DWU98_12935 [Dyella monticola]|uniref:Uncharacterized protein n=1 Tax=Dyella monticola TaxID=1927958 RepID=A0A370WXN9_9GAMM|nr:hypothetical protein DWU98_12935 [Dyella monticola]
MIPLFNQSGVLPPFVGTDPTVMAGCSPYHVKSTELVAAFATSPERNSLLRQLFQYRADLRAIGIATGFQWLDGSFMENVEIVRGRPPKDIDLVTFAHRPQHAQTLAQWGAFISANSVLFLPPIGNLDAYFVDLNLPVGVLVSRTAYWAGLFSHQRVTALWKGLLQLDLAEDDAAAISTLGALP